ncbi:hypothetical protein ENSA7_04430 [Enhygromyxa salina]|uniref:Uncharacterized protein n=1 Tax=Enhygromyxa salina TaxID=215803 RepID=A0A2S9YXN7_9BACT|nr:hypothetical protein ENSA7_04430 [Enhygromyxa salina]
MHDERAAQVAPQLVVSEGDRQIQELGRVVGRHIHHIQDPAKPLAGERPLAAGHWDIGDHRPGHDPVALAANDLVLRVFCDEFPPARLRPRIVGDSRRARGDRLLDPHHEFIAQRPVLRDQQHLRRRAVVPGVLGERGSELPGVIVELALGVGPRRHDIRRDAAKLGGERPLVDPLPRGLAARSLVGISTPYDCIVGRVGAGHVDRVDLGVLAQVLAHLDPAVDHPHEAGVDQRLERALDVRAVDLVDRVHLEQHHLVIDEQLVQHVGRAQEDLVARAHDQRDLAGPGLTAGLAPVDPALLGQGPGLEPQVDVPPGEQRLVEQGLREHANDPLIAVWRGAAALGHGRRRGVVLERVDEVPDAARHRQESGEPLLALGVGARRDALERAGARDPGVGLGLERDHHLAQQLDARLDPGGHPAIRAGAQLRDRGVDSRERRGIEWGRATPGLNGVHGVFSDSQGSARGRSTRAWGPGFALSSHPEPGGTRGRARTSRAARTG